MSTKQRASRFLEPHPSNPLTTALIQHRAKHEESPIFDSLNSVDYWSAQFLEIERQDLMEQARSLGLPIYHTIPTIKLRALLIGYFQREVEKMSHGEH